MLMYILDGNETYINFQIDGKETYHIGIPDVCEDLLYDTSLQGTQVDL